MLFNSYAFLFAFLPIALIGYQIAGRLHRRAVIGWLGAISLAFYAYWRPELIYVLIFSIAVNYLAASLISGQIRTRVPLRIWLISAIVIDLGTLSYFKYLFPSLNFLSHTIGSGTHWPDVILPIGISFFTFTQIAFLIDLYQGIAKQQGLSSYVLFVTFFPHLIAGPILHHKEMMPQFRPDRRYQLHLPDVAIGFTWFLMGLGKKVLLADSFAQLADPIFNAHQPLGPAIALIGALAFCLQLYFDFSGYSDMALGLARMFSIDFPLNFNSPFKAVSIIDFWQRWHMTLSNYIMSYIFTPLQMRARARRQAKGKGVSRKDMVTVGAFGSLVGGPMMITLLIAGVWHGAGLQYVVYGLLHGSYLCVNHAWRYRFAKGVVRMDPKHRFQLLKRLSSTLLTFVCVVISFVVFRSAGMSDALSMLSSIAGMHRDAAFTLPGSLAPKFARLIVGFAIVWCLPNTQQILSLFRPSLQESAWATKSTPRGLLWVPNTVWAVAFGSLFLLALWNMQDPSTFLYFQF
jgi:D-alanyl-lipoteichoic acid acyltransferase DltB (MBOAT superfamily)